MHTEYEEATTENAQERREIDEKEINKSFFFFSFFFQYTHHFDDDQYHPATPESHDRRAETSHGKETAKRLIAIYLVWLVYSRLLRNVALYSDYTTRYIYFFLAEVPLRKGADEIQNAAHSCSQQENNKKRRRIPPQERKSIIQILLSNVVVLNKITIPFLRLFVFCCFFPPGINNRFANSYYQMFILLLLLFFFSTKVIISHEKVQKKRKDNVYKERSTALFQERTNR